jgi:hypothetical protein
MESAERSPIIDAVTGSRRPYPRLTEAQKERVLSELGQEYDMKNLRPTHEAGDTASPNHAP